MSFYLPLLEDGFHFGQIVDICGYIDITVGIYIYIYIYIYTSVSVTHYPMIYVLMNPLNTHLTTAVLIHIKTDCVGAGWSRKRFNVGERERHYVDRLFKLPSSPGCRLPPRSAQKRLSTFPYARVDLRTRPLVSYNTSSTGFSSERLIFKLFSAQRQWA